MGVSRQIVHAWLPRCRQKAWRTAVTGSGQDSAAWPRWRSMKPAYPAGRQAWTASAVFS